MRPMIVLSLSVVGIVLGLAQVTTAASSRGNPEAGKQLSIWKAAGTAMVQQEKPTLNCPARSRCVRPISQARRRSPRRTSNFAK